MENLEDLLLQVFKENKMYYDFSASDDDLEVYVEWGDWKHDHLCLDHLLREKGLVKFDEEVTESDGSDTYSSTHYYKRKDAPQLGLSSGVYSNSKNKEQC